MHLVKIGGKISETDPCLVTFRSKEGILGAATIWVDDYLVVGGRKLVEFVQEKIQEEFTVGRIARDSFKYLGIQIEVIKEGGFVQHQKDYIQKLEDVQILAKDMKESK